MWSRRRQVTYKFSHLHQIFFKQQNEKNPENETGSLVKSPIIDQSLHFKNQFCSIFRKHFISVLHFAIPFMYFAPDIDSKILTVRKRQIHEDAEWPFSLDILLIDPGLQ